MSASSYHHAREGGNAHPAGAGNRGITVLMAVLWLVAAGLAVATIWVGVDVGRTLQRDDDLAAHGRRAIGIVVDAFTAPGPRSLSTRYLLRYRVEGSTTVTEAEVTEQVWRSAAESGHLDLLVSPSDPNSSVPVGAARPTWMPVGVGAATTLGLAAVAHALALDRRRRRTRAESSDADPVRDPEEIRRLGPMSVQTRDGSRWARVTGRETLTYADPNGRWEIYADAFGGELALSRDHIVDGSSGTPLDPTSRARVLAAAMSLLAAAGEQVEILEDRPRPIPGFPFDALGGERKPSEARDILSALVGRVVTSVCRYEPDDGHQPARSPGAFERAEGPALVTFDNGVVLAVGWQPSWNSLTVWVDSVPHGRPRPTSVGADPDMVAYDLADPHVSTVPAGSVGSRVVDWRIYQHTLHGRTGDVVLVLGTRADPLAFTFGFPEPSADLSVVEWERVRRDLTGSTPIRVERDSTR